MRRLFRIGRGEDGVVAVEWALIFFPVIFVIWAIMSFGNAFWTWNTMQLAVGEGARYAMWLNAYKTNSTSGKVECNDGGTTGNFEDYVATWIRSNLVAFTSTSAFTINVCSDYTSGVPPYYLTINVTIPWGAITLKSGAKVPLV
jgi:Flp pilus assembly protein TadG